MKYILFCTLFQYIVVKALYFISLNLHPVRFVVFHSGSSLLSEEANSRELSLRDMFGAGENHGGAGENHKECGDVPLN